jgi:hypothetical protein
LKTEVQRRIIIDSRCGHLTPLSAEPIKSSDLLPNVYGIPADLGGIYPGPDDPYWSSGTIPSPRPPPPPPGPLMGQPIPAVRHGRAYKRRAKSQQAFIPMPLLPTDFDHTHDSSEGGDSTADGMRDLSS